MVFFLAASCPARTFRSSIFSESSLSSALSFSSPFMFSSFSLSASDSLSARSSFSALILLRVSMVSRLPPSPMLFSEVISSRLFFRVSLRASMLLISLFFELIWLCSLNISFLLPSIFSPASAISAAIRLCFAILVSSSFVRRSAFSSSSPFLTLTSSALLSSLSTFSLSWDISSLSLTVSCSM